MNRDEEAELVRRAKSEPEAFGILYEQYYGQIFGYVCRRVLIWEVAQDITSEVFIKAYQSIWRFRWTNISIAAWFYRIATNEVNLYFRQRKYVPDSLDDLIQRTGFDAPDLTSLEEEKARLETQLQQYQDFIAIQTKIKDLPVKYQEVITLRYFEQKSIGEISEILNKNEGTIKSLLSRGIGRLKNLL